MGIVRPIERGDLGEVVRMRTALWPDGAADHEAEVLRELAGESPLGTAYAEQFPVATLVATREAGQGSRSLRPDLLEAPARAS